MTSSVPKPDPSSSAAGPWNLKGVDPQARELAQDLAKRAGLSLGEWLNQMIADVKEEPAKPSGKRSAARIQAGEASHIAYALAELTGRLDEVEHRSTLAISGVGQQALSLFARMDGVERDQAGVVALLDGAIAEMRDTGGRVAQRLSRLESGEDARVEAMKAMEDAVGLIAAQIEEGQVRAGDHAAHIQEGVSALCSRIEEIEARPIPDVSPLDAALARLAERVDQIESVPAPTFDTSSIDAAFARLLYRVEDGQHHTEASMRAIEGAVAGLDERMARVETPSDTPAWMAEVFREEADVHQAMEVSEETAAHDTDAHEMTFADEAPDVAEATDADDAVPEHEIVEAMAYVWEPAEVAFAAEPAVDMIEDAPEPALAAHGSSEAVVAEMEAAMSEDAEAHEPVSAADAEDAVMELEQPEPEAMSETVHVEPAPAVGEGPLDRIEAAVRHLAEQMAASERRSAETMERMGGEMALVAQGLDGRMGEVERRSDERTTQMAGEIARIADAFEGRLSRADGAQAQALEKLGERIRESDARTERLIAETRERLEVPASAAERQPGLDTVFQAPSMDDQAAAGVSEPQASRGSTRELIEHAFAAARAHADTHRRASEDAWTAQAPSAAPEPAPEADETPAPRGAFSLLRLRRRERAVA